MEGERGRTGFACPEPTKPDLFTSTSFDVRNRTHRIRYEVCSEKKVGIQAVQERPGLLVIVYTQYMLAIPRLCQRKPGLDESAGAGL